MATVEGLNQVQGLVDQSGQQLDQQARMTAAQKASELFKQGDIKGAISSLAAVDPAHAMNFMSVLSKIDPSTIGAIANAKSQGALPGQIGLQNVKNSGALAVANVKANAPKPQDQVVRADPNSPSGFSRINKKTGAYQPVQQPNLPQPQPNQSNLLSDASGQPTPPDQQPKPNLRPNQDVDSNGQIITINPAQRKIIDSARKTFDSESKDLVKSMDNLSQAQRNIQDNIPGQGTIEKLRILKGVVSGRINQQEFQAFGKGQGIINQIDNAISEAEGKGMSPKVQQLMSQMVSAALQVTSSEFDTHLKNAIDRNPEVDPLVLKKRLVGEHGPAIYQDFVKKVAKLPPDEQAAANWAHDNPQDKRAPQILKALGF